MPGVKHSSIQPLITACLSAVIAVYATSVLAEGKAPEKFIPPEWKIEDTVRGDLTGDNREDIVFVLIGKRNKSEHAGDDRPRMMMVLMQQSDGTFEQVGLNNKLLLCGECFGAMGGGPEISINKNVLIVDQLTGSRFTDQGIWRFRFDSQAQKMRLIGLDIKHQDRGNGSGTSESTNYLTGKRITESHEYNEKRHESVLSKLSMTTVTVPKIFLEQATSEGLQ